MNQKLSTNLSRSE